MLPSTPPGKSSTRAPRPKPPGRKASPERKKHLRAGRQRVLPAREAVVDPPPAVRAEVGGERHQHHLALAAFERGFDLREHGPAVGVRQAAGVEAAAVAGPVLSLPPRGIFRRRFAAPLPLLARRMHLVEGQREEWPGTLGRCGLGSAPAAPGTAGVARTFGSHWVRPPRLGFQAEAPADTTRRHHKLRTAHSAVRRRGARDPVSASAPEHQRS
jgi:hypothetical protein